MFCARLQGKGVWPRATAKQTPSGSTVGSKRQHCANTCCVAQPFEWICRLLSRSRILAAVGMLRPRDHVRRNTGTVRGAMKGAATLMPFRRFRDVAFLANAS